MSETNPKLNFTHESCSDTGCITFYVNGEEITDWYQETDAEDCQNEFKRIYMAGYNKALAQKDAEIERLKRRVNDTFNYCEDVKKALPRLKLEQQAKGVEDTLNDFGTALELLSDAKHYKTILNNRAKKLRQQAKALENGGKPQGGEK